VADADVRIAGDAVTDGYVAAILNGEAGDFGPVEHNLGEVEQQVRESIAVTRRELVSDGRTVETYRRLTLDEALGALLPA
jgi:hypothetical protein